MNEQETTLKDIKETIDDINAKVSFLEETNREVMQTVHTNYGLIQTIFKQNDKNLKTIENKNSNSLKIVYGCIILVLLIIGIVMGFMLRVHFLK